MISSLTQIEILELSLISENQSKDILDFHLQHISPHLYVRDQAFFEAIKKNKVFSLLEISSQKIVGICYISNDSEGCGDVRHEFGGVCIDPKYHKTGLSEVLCKLSLIHRFSYENPKGRIVSHIHEHNCMPVNLFENKLKFDHVGFEVMPEFIVKKSQMQTNAKGLLVGELYRLKLGEFSQYERWLKKIKVDRFQVISKKQSFKIQSDLLSIQFVDDTIENLKSYAKEKYLDRHRCIKCFSVQIKNNFVRYK